MVDMKLGAGVADSTTIVVSLENFLPFLLPFRREKVFLIGHCRQVGNPPFPIGAPWDPSMGAKGRLAGGFGPVTRLDGGLICFLVIAC
jgi:hypothetical protein